MNIAKQENQKINQIFICNYCEDFKKEVWANKKETISCCEHCWGNHPMVARATNGKPFRSNKIYRVIKLRKSF